MKSFRAFLEKFNPHFNIKTGEARKHRHMADNIPDVATHSASGGKTVPEYCKADNNAVQEFESLKKQNSGVKYINRIKASKLANSFNLKNMSGKLGNTGISLRPHTTPNMYILQK